MKVLVGIDGSEGGWEALRQAAWWITPQRDQLVAYYAPPRVKVAKRGGSPDDLTERMRLGVAHAVFDEARGRLPGELASGMETILGVGDPREELLRAADDYNVDLIVVGARGLGPIRSMFMGSVSQVLARHAHQPVLIARRKADKASDPTLRVLVPLDAIPPSRRMNDFLCQLAWPAQCQGRLMHVVESLFGGELPEWLLERANYAKDEEVARTYLHEMENTKHRKFDELTSYRAQLPAAFANEAPIVLEGYPAEQILHTAAADDVDVIVMGRKEMSGFERFMIGSTAERVTLYAPCSVLLVHHH
jgi:nucleotide-binding universal stress UspA family protein